MQNNRLRGKIREVCGTETTFADAMGMNKSTLSQKLNGKTEFSKSEIEKACDVLEISVDSIPYYFFGSENVKSC